MPKQSQKSSKRRSHSTPANRTTAHSKAIITVPAAPSRPWQLNDDEVTLVKNHIAKGASDSELQFCLTVARRYKLDPFRGQIWFVKRADKSAQGGERWIPIVGINGLLHVAARDHRDFGSIEEPEYGPMKKIEWTYYEKKGSIMAPEWAKVTCWKKGFEHPIKATVYFEEIYPNVGASPMVRQMPRHMLGKCATAHVVRKAWPGTDGLYIREEFQGPPEFTDSGRRIVYPDAEPSQPAPLIENAPHGHEPGSEKAKQAEAALARVEAADKELKAKKVPGSNPGREAAHVDSGSTESEGLKPSAATSRKHLEIDLTNPEDPIVRGDTGDLLPQIETRIVATWGKDEFWHVRPVDVNTIHAAGKAIGFDVTEFRVPSEGKGATQGKAQVGASAQTKTAPNTQRKETKTNTSAAAGGTVSAGEPLLVAGTIERVFVTLKGNKPFAMITISTQDGKKREAGCWDKDMQEYLEKGKGKKAEVFFQTKGQYTNIVGLKQIGAVEFEDGKIPVSRRDREPGAAGNLFQP